MRAKRFSRISAERREQIAGLVADALNDTRDLQSMLAKVALLLRLAISCGAIASAWRTGRTIGNAAISAGVHVRQHHPGAAVF